MFITDHFIDMFNVTTTCPVLSITLMKELVEHQKTSGRSASSINPSSTLGKHSMCHECQALEGMIATSATARHILLPAQ